jgi:hypothetical protein
MMRGVADGRRGDRAAVVALALLALVAHRPVAMLRAPFWLDEAWVADSVRMPLSALRGVTSSSPIGFSFLLRLVPPLGPVERLRLVPLLFATALGPLAFWLGRELDREHRLTAYVTGVAGAALPAGLLRHDLKQYTADAAVAIVLLTLGARVERRHEARATGALGGAAAAGCFVSHTTTLVAAAVFGALVLTALGRREFRYAAQLAGIGALTAVWLLAVYAAFARPGQSDALTEYWRAYYVPATHQATFLHERTLAMLHFTGAGPPLVALALLVAGIVALVRAKRPATALVLPLLTVIVLVAAKAHVYPLWDKRTGLFYFALATMVAAYAVARAAVAAAARATWAAAVPLTVGAVLLGSAAVPNARTHVPYENVRGFARYLATHAAPGDRILVHADDAYGFAFYWHADAPRYVKVTDRANGFLPAYPPASRVQVVTPEIANAGVADGLVRSGTVWLVLAHVTKARLATYETAAAQGIATTVSTDGGTLLKVERR